MIGLLAILPRATSLVSAVALSFDCCLEFFRHYVVEIYPSYAEGGAG